MKQQHSFLQQFLVRPKRLPKSTLITVAVLVVGALLVLSMALVYLRRAQDLRQQAVQVTDSVNLNLRGQTRGDKLYLEVTLNSKTYDVAGLELVGSIEGVETNKISVNTDNPLNLQPVITELTAGTLANTSAFFISQFASLDANKPANTHGADQVVASFVISNPPTTGITLALSNQTKAPIINEPLITVNLPIAQTFTYSPGQGGTGPTPTPQADSDKKSCNQNCATDTECQSQFQCYKGQCRLRDYLEDSNCVGTPDRGLQRSCNQYCADSRECAAGFTCYYNQCRNPLNVTNSSCANPAPVQVSTGTGGSGARPTGQRPASPSPTPRVVATRVVINPSPTPRVSPRPATATPSATAVATRSASPRASATASPRASIIPVPAEEPTTSNRATTALLLVLVLVGMAGIGFALFKLLKR